MTKNKLVIGVDIGGSHIKSAVVDLTEEKILEDTVVDVKIDNKGTANAIMESWASAINGSITKVENGTIEGVGFAMPGAFNYKDGIALFEGNDKYENLYNVSIEENLKPLLNASENLKFRYHNDATCFAIGVDWFGKAKDFNRSVSITLGTGFGSAFIEDGLPIVNREGVAPEGCFWHLPYRDGTADDYFSTRWFVNEYEKVSGTKVSGVKGVADNYSSDPNAKALFVDFGTRLGEFLLPYMKSFNTEIIVIGGNVCGAFDLFGGELKEVFRNGGIETKVEPSILKEDAALIGSARLLNDEFYSKIKDDLPTK